MSAVKWKVVAIMLVATVAVSVGETLLSKGMKQTNTAGPGLFAQARAVLNWAVLCGMFLMAAYFGLYMIALKWADLSFVLPLTAVSYLLGALLARYYLHETVTQTRWIGALIITAGVVIVGLGEQSGPGN
ncbi:MAG TPA: EamA family transporter [Chthonomonadaceae bacterium]|nr:EamA family transporter [Chthonomonadaceae bacterium]